MAANNIYDSIIADLIHRANITDSSFNSAYINVYTNQEFNDKVPFDFNSNVIFTAELKNIPAGYTVKANSFVLDYPSTPDTVGSGTTLSSPATAVLFTTIGQTFVVNASVILENGINPNIILTKTFTLSAYQSVFSGSKATNNTFTLTGLTSKVEYLDLYEFKDNIEVTMGGTAVYPYIVIPAASSQPICFKDENDNVLPLSSFTMTVNSGYNYYVLNWATTFAPSTGLKWKIQF